MIEYLNIKKRINIVFYLVLVFISLFIVKANAFAIDYGYDKSQDLIEDINIAIDLINNYRVENNVHPLKTNDTLMLVADIRARELVFNFNEKRADGTSTYDMLKTYGYFNSMYSPAINMASGVSDPYFLVTAWMEREDSRELLLLDRAEEIGIGVTRNNGNYYWFAILYSQNLNDDNKVILQNVLSNIIHENMTDIDKIKAVHDYICLLIDYDHSYQYRSISEALLYKKAVCQGYANLFKAFMDLLGIQNEFVVGHANGEIIDPTFTEYNNHSWNTVTLNGITYHIDTTWDDVTEEYNLICYDCFMVDKATIDKIHNSAKLLITDNMGTISAKYIFDF